jgi:hypothetical protein
VAPFKRTLHSYDELVKLPDGSEVGASSVKGAPPPRGRTRLLTLADIAGVVNFVGREERERIESRRDDSDLSRTGYAAYPFAHPPTRVHAEFSSTAGSNSGSHPPRNLLLSKCISLWPYRSVHCHLRVFH